MGRGRRLSRGEGAWFPFGVARGGGGGDDGDLEGRELGALEGGGGLLGEGDLPVSGAGS